MRSDANTEEDFWQWVVKGDDCWTWQGRPTSSGYGRIHLNGRQVYAHRASYELNVGTIPAGMQIDHICRNRMCVRPEHLHAVSGKRNQENHGGAQVNSKSGVRGVFRNGAARTWLVQVTHHRVVHHGGCYKTLAEANAAAVALRIRLHDNNHRDRMEHA